MFHVFKCRLQAGVHRLLCVHDVHIRLRNLIKALIILELSRNFVDIFFHNPGIRPSWRRLEYFDSLVRKRCLKFVEKPGYVSFGVSLLGKHEVAHVVLINNHVPLPVVTVHDLFQVNYHAVGLGLHELVHFVDVFVVFAFVVVVVSY
jgi:hypothetical protein